MKQNSLKSENANGGISLRRLTPYPAYKDSGVEWLGEIPEYWNLEKLKYSVDLINEKVDLPMIGKSQYVGMENVESWAGRFISGHTNTEPEGLSNVFHEGDVLFGKLRPYLAKALCAVVGGICSSEFLVLRPKRVTQRYLFRSILTNGFVHEVDSSTYGTKMPRANWNFIGNLPMAVPSVSEQTSIADFLDRETAKIDVLVAKKERLIELLQEKRTALITHAVTKGLDPSAPMKDSGVEWLGDVPAHWECRVLGTVLIRITYGFTNPMPVADDGPYMLTANDIGDGKVLYESARKTTHEAFERDITDKSRPQIGDILLTKDGSLGRIAVADGTPACINQSVALLRVDTGAAVIDFVQHALRASVYQERMVFEAGGTTIKHIYITRLVKMAVAFPPQNEQEEICHFVSEEREKIGRQISKVREAVDVLKEYRTALISAAVTGKIDVRDEMGQ